MDTREDGTWRQNQIAIDLFEKRLKKGKRSKSKKSKTEPCTSAASQAKESSKKRKNEKLDVLQKSSDERKARAPAKKAKLATNQRVEKSKVTVLKKASKSKKLKKSHVESDANNVVADRKLLNDYEPDLRESHLDILSVNKMVKDAVIDFYACFLLENELSNRSAFFFNTFLSDLAQRGEFHLAIMQAQWLSQAR